MRPYRTNDPSGRHPNMNMCQLVVFNTCQLQLCYHFEMKPRIGSDEIIGSAIALAKHLVSNRPKNSLGAHLKELLNVLVWKVSEANGKYNTRYWSEGFYKNPDKNSCEHEHVIEKKKIVQQLLNEPDRIEEIMKSVVACLVLADEHKLLTKLSKSSPELDGWERYKMAGVRVWDTVENRFLW